MILSNKQIIDNAQMSQEILTNAYHEGYSTINEPELYSVTESIGELIELAKHLEWQAEKLNKNYQDAVRNRVNPPVMYSNDAVLLSKEAVEKYRRENRHVPMWFEWSMAFGAGIMFGHLVGMLLEMLK